MAFVRCYTGTDGQSHFEDLDLLPPDIERSIGQAASSISFTRSPNGRFTRAQCAASPVRHFPLRGPDGGRDRRWDHAAVRPQRAVLFEDLTGQGHTSRSVGGDRLTAIVPLAD